MKREPLMNLQVKKQEKQEEKEVKQLPGIKSTWVKLVEKAVEDKSPAMPGFDLNKHEWK